MKEIHERSLTQRMQRRHATCPRVNPVAHAHVSTCAPRVHVSTVCSPPRVSPVVHMSIEAKAEPAQRARARGDAATCKRDEQPHDATWTRALDATWTRALDAKVTRVLVTRRRVM